MPDPHESPNGHFNTGQDTDATTVASRIGPSLSVLPTATAAAFLVAAGLRKEKPRGRRARVVRQLGPRAATELLEARPKTEPEAHRDEGLRTAKPWELLSGIAKDAARTWFVQRAEDRGIPWRFSVERMQAQQEQLEATYQQICNESIEYPDYYQKAFHGYDGGNLNWAAAHELEAATKSMCLGYYDGLSWQEAQEIFRGSARRSIAEYWQLGERGDESPQALLDVGCSGGFSTKEMAMAFPTASAVGLDLSPYFLSVAKQSYPELGFVHANAECTGLPDASYDVVTLNFLLHELPLEASRNVLKEAYRLLKPGGVLAVLDVDAKRLQALPAFRRWAFQVTEPWCKDGEYFSLDLSAELNAFGFLDVRGGDNDPVNALTLARKSI
ncbi:tam [Symbiodinium sp. CCMP2592]|nr:tam [Symbiodinium sp. CCMP2592]